MKKFLPFQFKLSILLIIVLFQISIPLFTNAQLQPFTCTNGVAYQVSGTPISSLYSYNVSTGERTITSNLLTPTDRTSAPVAPATTNIRVNATGYNTDDNMIWGWEDLNLGQVVRIDQNGFFERFTIPNLPRINGSTIIPYNCGEVLPNGYLVLYQSNNSKYYIIDINPTRPTTYLQLVDANKVLQNAGDYGITLTQVMNVNDFVFNPTTNLIQSLNNAAGALPANYRKLVTLNPFSGQVIVSNSVIESPTGTATNNNIGNETGNFGAVFLDANNNFFVFANNSSNFYRINTTTNLATHLSTSTTSNSNDGASCRLAVLALAIRGNVFNDANGLIGTPANTIDGTPTNINGLLKVVLYNVTLSKVEDTVFVKSDGTFEFSGIPNNNYRLYLTTAAVTIGQTTVPTVLLPNNWVHTGEFDNNGVGSDNLNNGILSIGALTTDKLNNKFGVEQTPVSSPVNYNLTTIPTSNSVILLDGNNANAPLLSGNDAEDQPTNGSLVGKKINITQLPTNGQLLYQGVVIQFGADGINPPSVTNPFTITNLSATDLSIKLTGSGYNMTEFKYSYVDKANVTSAPASYVLNWGTPLPVTLKNFKVINDGACKAMVIWEVSIEDNISYYEVEMSNDGINFDFVAKVMPTGSNSTYNYNYDQLIQGTRYFRLKIREANQESNYSEITKVNFNCNQEKLINVYPTTTSNITTIEGLNAGDVVNVYNATGVSLNKFVAKQNKEQLNLSKLANGIYLVVISTKDAESQSFKIIKN